MSVSQKHRLVYWRETKFVSYSVHHSLAVEVKGPVCSDVLREWDWGVVSAVSIYYLLSLIYDTAIAVGTVVMFME